MINVPDRIWLIVGEEAEEGEDFDKLRWDAEVMWSDDQVNDNDIAYTRANLAQPSVPDDVGEIIAAELYEIYLDSWPEPEDDESVPERGTWNELELPDMRADFLRAAGRIIAKLEAK